MTILVIGDLEDDDAGDCIIRGHLTKNAVTQLHTGPYQRSANFSPAKTKRMVQAIEKGDIRKFPDIILGMRGHNWQTTNAGIELVDPVYIIDGVQRCCAWDICNNNDPERNYRLGVKCYINTNQDMENELFRKYNTGHTAMAPSIILRNEKEHNKIAAMLYGLSHQKDFALCNRIAWDQVRAHRAGADSELVKGSILLRVLVALHRHKLRNSTSGGASILDFLHAVTLQIDDIGLQQVRENLLMFFDVLDEAWGVRTITGTRSVTHLHAGWMETLAAVFSAHTDFWVDSAETELSIKGQTKIDLKRMDLEDPEIARLVRGNKSSRELLFAWIVQRLNKGKVTNRVQLRRGEDSARAAAQAQGKQL